MGVSVSISSSMSHLVEPRTKKLEGVEDDSWAWPIADKGAYSGPFSDWNNSHRNTYFKNVKHFGRIITAGANMGVYVRAYSDMFESVYAFEPHWINFYCLMMNNPKPNVFAYRGALGDRAEVLSLTDQPQQNMGGYSMVGNGPKNTPTFRIDDISKSFGTIDMIQLDVEAFEYRVLCGARETLERDSPVVVLERPSEDATSFLATVGYSFQERSISDWIYFKH